MTAQQTREDSTVDFVIKKARDRYLLQEHFGAELDSPQNLDSSAPPAKDSESSAQFATSVRAQFSALERLTASKEKEKKSGAKKPAKPTSAPTKVALPPPPKNKAGIHDPASIASIVSEISTEEPILLSEAEQEAAIAGLEAQLFGLGILEPLLQIENITDIFVNGPQDVWFEAGGTLHQSEISFVAEPDVRALAGRLINSAGGRLDEAYPSADVQNERGQRIHAIIPPLSQQGTVLSIRIQPARRASLAELQNKKMFSAEMGSVLRYIVRHRSNFLISGGTGTGKTTLLNAMLSECSSAERIITIEDSAELAPQHPHVVSLQSKVANAEGRGHYSLSDLIQQALRMRPSRLVLGECRGAEVADMLTAMNTGHSGTGGTVHANSAQAVPARLLAMGSMAGLSQDALSLQADTAVEFVIHISRGETTRFISEIAVLHRHNGHLQTESLCRVETGRRRDMVRWNERGQLLLEVAQQEEASL